MEEEAAVALTNPATARRTRRGARRRHRAAQEGPRHLEGHHLDAAWRAVRGGRPRPEGDRLPLRRRGLRDRRDAARMGIHRSRHPRGGRCERRHAPRAGGAAAWPGAARLALPRAVRRERGTARQGTADPRAVSRTAAHRRDRHEGPARLRRSDVREPAGVHRPRGQGRLGRRSDHRRPACGPAAATQWHKPHPDARRRAALGRQCALSVAAARRRRTPGAAADVPPDGARAGSVPGRSMRGW